MSRVVTTLDVPARSEPSAGTLVWVHGLGESSRCFAPILESSALGRWRHLCVDLPGYGGSERPLQPLRLQALAELLGEWASRHVSGEYTLIGHSMGGVIGQLLCELAPAGLVGLVNIEGNLTSGDCTGSALAASYSLEAFIDGGFERLLADTRRTGETDAAQQSYSRSLRLCDPEQFHLNAVELVELSESEGLAARFAALTMPRLYIFGSPSGAASRSLELLRDNAVSAVSIEPAGHWPFIDQPDAFVGALRDFLA